MYCSAPVLLPSNSVKVHTKDHYRFVERNVNFFKDTGPFCMQIKSLFGVCSNASAIPALRISFNETGLIAQKTKLGWSFSEGRVK